MNRLLTEGRYFPARLLKKANELAIRRNYNRSIYFHKYMKEVHKTLKDIMGDEAPSRRKDVNIPIAFAIEHHHKGGKECERHVRCMLLGGILVDCDIDIWNSLPRADVSTDDKVTVTQRQMSIAELVGMS